MNGPLLRGSGELHIVGPREVVTIADRDGVVHRLLALADGSRSPQEIFAALATNHPLLGEQEVLDALEELEDAGLIEDCMALGPIRSGRRAWAAGTERMMLSSL
jgi:hypothetical protein